MERLLGARASFTLEARPVSPSPPHSPRGAPYEELSEGADTSKYKSPLADAIRESNRAHRRTMAQLPTGAPHLTSESRSIPAAHAHRAPLRVVRVAPDSYAGIGTVERNRKRAARRAQQRAKRAAQASV